MFRLWRATRTIDRKRLADDPGVAARRREREDYSYNRTR
jgi:hypothetical protein